MYAPRECTASSSLPTSLSSVGAFFTLHRIPTRHKRSGQDATNGLLPHKSEVVVFHILVCTGRSSMCLQHCMLKTRVIPGERLTPCLRRMNAWPHLYHAPRCLCRLATVRKSCHLRPCPQHYALREAAQGHQSRLADLLALACHDVQHGACACSTAWELRACGVYILMTISHICAPRGSDCAATSSPPGRRLDAVRESSTLYPYSTSAIYPHA